MNFPAIYDQLLYEHEVLLAKYEIREHYLTTHVRNIYENIGQMLHAIRLELSMLTFEIETQKKRVEDTGELVGQVMRDLRRMCRSFYPAHALFDESGLLHILHHEITLSNMTEKQLQIIGRPCSLDVGKEAIISRMLQEMFLWIRKQESEKTLNIKVTYSKAILVLMLTYVGNAVKCNASVTDVAAETEQRRLSLLERAELIGASLSSTSKKDNRICIKFLIPLKTSSYE